MRRGGTHDGSGGSSDGIFRAATRTSSGSDGEFPTQRAGFGGEPWLCVCRWLVGWLPCDMKQTKAKAIKAKAETTVDAANTRQEKKRRKEKKRKELTSDGSQLDNQS